MQIKALVLDFGGVISRTLFETHAHSEWALGLPAGTLNWRGPFAAAGEDLLWEAVQRNEISERGYWLTRTREVGTLMGEDWCEMQTLVSRARGSDLDAIIRPEALDTIHKAHAAGYRLAILSNELDLFYGKALREQLSFLALFEVIVDATYTQILKPDPRSYLNCCELLGLSPSQCVFVDDQVRNVQGAVAVGMQTVQFEVTAPEKSYAQVRQLLKLA